MARAVSVLGEGVQLPVIAALVGLPEDRTAAALADLVRAEVVHDEQPLRFVHPLVREAVYRDVPAAERSLRHEQAADLLRRVGAPDEQVAPVVLDDAAVKPYTAVDSVHADPVDPMPVVEGSTLLGAFPAEAAESLLAVAGPGSGSPQVMVEVRQLGGAYARETEHASAFDHRHAAFSVLTVGMAPDPTVPGHAELVLAALDEWSTGGVWPNFAPPSDAAAARRAYAPATLDRLQQIARTYDSDGVLSLGSWTREARLSAAAV